MNSRHWMFATLAVSLCMGSASANVVAYMTGTSDPYGLPASDPGSPEYAMEVIHGVGGYDRYNGFDNAIFTMGYESVYLEGSDVASGEFLATYDAAAAQSYVDNGGRLYVNAAIDDWGGLDSFEVAYGILLKPGESIMGTSGSHSDNGAGFAWTGLPFAQGIIDDTSRSIDGPNAPIWADAGAVYSWYNSPEFGYLFIGTLTAPALQEPFSQAAQLRVNLTCLLDPGLLGSCGTVIPPIPEPATWVMMLAGFGLVGCAARRQQRPTALAQGRLRSAGKDLRRTGRS